MNANDLPNSVFLIGHNGSDSLGSKVAGCPPFMFHGLQDNDGKKLLCVWSTPQKLDAWAKFSSYEAYVPLELGRDFLCHALATEKVCHFIACDPTLSFEEMLHSGRPNFVHLASQGVASRLFDVIWPTFEQFLAKEGLKKDFLQELSVFSRQHPELYPVEWLQEFNNVIKNSPDRGFLYVVVNPSMQGLVKIGKTSRVPAERVRELSGATGVPTPFILVYQAWFANCSEAELLVHALLEKRNYRVSPNREFFNAPANEAIDAVMEVKKHLASSSDNIP
jgi:hypothetical protein